MPWQRKRMWLGPPAHVLLHKFTSAARGMLMMQTNVNRASLAYLWDHQVYDTSLPALVLGLAQAL